MKVKPRPQPKLPLQEFDYEQLGKDIRKLAGADLGGLQINIWPTKEGFQANVAVKAQDGWSVHMGRNPLDALQRAIHYKKKGLRLPG